jgi:riboflavin synthase
MFTGIIETLGKIIEIRAEKGNLHFRVESSISKELKIDQSVAHNGICLTVTYCDQHVHEITAIAETIQKTTCGTWVVGQILNLERCMQMNGRLDGHIVQGHVDTTALCTSVAEEQGSWRFTFRYHPHPQHITIEKGSICIDGISLTVVDSQENEFSVAIIPYTYAHTNMQNLKPDAMVNLEFDVIGKYVAKILQSQR